MVNVEVEVAIRERFEANDLHAAATLAIQGYGGEVCGYLAAILGDDELAREVFAEAAAEMWRDLSRFRWEASFRTWIYALARHRLAAHLKRHGRQRTVGLSEAPESAAQHVPARTTTAPWRRTDVKDTVRRLRQSLSHTDRELLVLRIDRGMSWRQIAQIVGGQEPALRQRFGRIKDRLRADMHGV